MAVTTAWEPPSRVSRDEIIRTTARVAKNHDNPVDEREDIFRVDSMGFAWDVGGKVFQPSDPDAVPTGPDGKRIGVVLLHGGSGDHRSLEPMARILSSKFGYKVVTVAYPGQFYFPDESRRWPGDTQHPDGTVRTPIWTIDSQVALDEYEVVTENSDPTLRARHGTMFFARAKEGSEFYYRLAAAPAAYEDIYRALFARNFPPEQYSIYLHGHSTGGPQMHMMLQRVENVAGLVGTESSPFGDIFSEMLDYKWQFPFNYMTVRTWRDTARYVGHQVELEAVRRLPWLMEDVLDDWSTTLDKPNMKFQDLVQFAAYGELEHGARVTAGRLALSEDETESLVRRYLGYPRELSGPGVRPVPPLLYGITAGSMDHRPERYHNILLPRLAAMNSAPKAHVVHWEAGVHSYLKPEPDLPQGLGPAIANLWNEAITNGYYL